MSVHDGPEYAHRRSSTQQHFAIHPDRGERGYQFVTDGSGDGPESVNQALHDAIHQVSWIQQSGTYKVVFLLCDVPPHMDNQDDVKYPDALREVRAKGIVVNAIQCGQAGDTTTEWQQIAKLGAGRYFEVEQAGNAVAIATSFDEKIASLSKKLYAMRLYYYTREEKEQQ